MLFKKATVVPITGEIPDTEEAIQAALEKHRFVPCRDMESERRGWVSPINEEYPELVRGLNGAFLIALKVQTKILPSSVIKEELKERLAARGMAGRKVRAKERTQLIEEIRFDLLPKAFSKVGRIYGYLDMTRKEIVIGTASANQADEFLACLRSAFGSLPARLLDPKESPQSRMTEWVKTQEAPIKVKFGQEITLEDPGEGGKGTFRKQDLTSDEITECIDAGKRVRSIALEWNSYLGFTIDERLVLRKIKPLDMFDEDYDGDSGDDEYAALDADFYLTVSGLRQLLPEIYTWFEVGSGSDEAGDKSGDDMALYEAEDEPLESYADAEQYEEADQEIV